MIRKNDLTQEKIKQPNLSLAHDMSMHDMESEYASNNEPGTPFFSSKRTVSIRCFSRFSICDNGELVLLRNKEAEELIALLTCERGTVVSKAKAAEML